MTNHDNFLTNIDSGCDLSLEYVYKVESFWYLEKSNTLLEFKFTPITKEKWFEVEKDYTENGFEIFIKCKKANPNTLYEKGLLDIKDNNFDLLSVGQFPSFSGDDIFGEDEGLYMFSNNGIKKNDFCLFLVPLETGVETVVHNIFLHHKSAGDDFEAKLKSLSTDNDESKVDYTIEKRQVKLDKSLYKFDEKVAVQAKFLNTYEPTCFILEIESKKIAIDERRIDVFNSFQDWERNFDSLSQNLYYIKESSILGFSGNIDDLFSDETNYVFTVDNKMEQNYYEDVNADEPITLLNLILSIAISDFEIISKANLCCLNSLLYCKKEDNTVNIMFEPIEDLVEYADVVMSDRNILNHNELWEVIDEFEITSIADAYFKEMKK